MTRRVLAIWIVGLMSVTAASGAEAGAAERMRARLVPGLRRTPQRILPLRETMQTGYAGVAVMLYRMPVGTSGTLDFEYDPPSDVKVAKVELEVNADDWDDRKEVSVHIEGHPPLALPDEVIGEAGGHVGRIAVPLDQLKRGRNRFVFTFRDNLGGTTQGLNVIWAALLVHEEPSPVEVFLGGAPGADDQDPSAKDGALVFDGHNDSVTAGGERDFELHERGTIAAWVRPAADQRSRLGVIVGKYPDYALARTDDGKLTFAYSYEDFTSDRGWKEATVAADVDVPPDQWTHVALTFKHGKVRFYINGKLRAAGRLAGAISRRREAPLRVGASLPHRSPFAGAIEGGGVFDWALDATDIKREMAATKP